MEELVGKSLGRYKIVSLLGEGGMGAVFKGRDITLQRDVAIKVMHPQYARMGDFQERFLQEARTAARLDHPGIVKVFDFGQQQSLLYIVMEFIPGDNLRKLLQNMRTANQWIQLPEALQIVRQITLALDYAHKQGILHRDIKPDNVMLKAENSEGLPFRPVLTDLGLAKLAEGGVLTQDGTSMGTPAYMSPEQALGEKTDARSDVYSMGILLFELATGQLPFPIKNLTDAIRYHVKEQPPDPRSIRADLPQPLSQTILKAVEKNPDNRFSDAAGLAQALEACLPALTAAPALPTALGGAVSIMTQYQQSLVEMRGQSIVDEFEQAFPGTPQDLTQDRIQILEADRTSRVILIKAKGMTIGRDSDNDLVINHTKISRHHARIEFDGANYRVTDLNSTNGTYLANAKLLPGISEVWAPDKVLQVGETWLRLSRAGTSLAPGTAPRSLEGTMADISRQRSVTGSGRIGLFLQPVQLSVAPGSSVTATAIILNQGTTVDHFKISVGGVQANWVILSSQVIQLLPSEQKEISLTIQPPRVTHSRAGTYPMTIRVASQSAPDQFAEAKTMLTVTAYTQLSSKMHPQKIRIGQTARLTIQNQSNTPVPINIFWQDRGDELVFQPPQAQLNIAEGQTASIEFHARPRLRAWLGGSKLTAFTTTISALSGETQTQSGELVSKAIIPPWVLGVIPMLCILMAVGAAAVLALINQKPKKVASVPTTTIPIQITTNTFPAPITTNTVPVPITTNTVPVLVNEPTITPILTMLPTPTDTPVPTGAWSGIWETTCELLMCNQLTLTQNGNAVTGNFAMGNGTITASIDGNRLNGTWSLGGATGPFDFWISADGTYWQGNWNRMFDWCGYRTGQNAPSPCGLASWYGTWTSVCGGSDCGALTVIQYGIDVVGSYLGGGGTIKATVSGRTMQGEWTEGGGSGKMAFFMMGDGQQFNGNWDSSNEWCGFRGSGSQPDPCLGSSMMTGFTIAPEMLNKLQPFIIPNLLPQLKQPVVTLAPIFINPNIILVPTPTSP
jgi:serine/threonine protein kinase